MHFPFVDFNFPIYKFPTVELILEALSLRFEQEVLKLPKMKGTEPLSILSLASGVQPPSTKQGRRGGSTEQGEDACLMNCHNRWLCSASRAVHSGAGWDSRESVFLQHVLASTKEEETPSTQICCPSLQASPQNPYVQSVIWVLRSHLWPQHENLIEQRLYLWGEYR